MHMDLKLLVRASHGMRMPLAYTMDEAAKELGLTRQRADWLASKFRLRSVLVRGRRYVTRREVERVRNRFDANA